MKSLFLFSFNNATKYDNLALIISIYNMNEKAISLKTLFLHHLKYDGFETLENN